jgi:PAS domain S-box-containing protein
MTEQPGIKQALKECERKFLHALRDNPLSMTLTSAIDHRYIEVNDTFERISGWNRHEVIGRTPFDIGIWVDPSQRLAVVGRLLSGGVVRDLEVHARLKNREEWTGSGSAALIEINGEMCVLSFIADATDLKRAEEVQQATERLSHMGHRLIQAREEERGAVARELHEYVERLVVLAIDLDRVGHSPAAPVSEISRRVDEARQRVEQLVVDVQTLSNRLHSSELELLGLAAAAATFCREFSNQKSVEIDFSSEGIPEQLPQEVSLCLFRVLQEALQNAVSHGRSQRMEVVLAGKSNQLTLDVRDFGIGFDPEDALKGPGLGVTIMRERLKLVAGELRVDSQRDRGTTIRARVPFAPP